MTHYTTRRRIRIANRRPGGPLRLAWRILLALIVWLLIAAPAVVAIAAVLVLRDYAADLPRTPDLDAWEERVPRTSVITAADGTVLAEIPFRDGPEVGHRFPVAFDDIPARLIQAVLAAEDVRFFAHGGVDVQAVMRAARANLRAGRVVEGASTLTQQVARNLLPEGIGNARTLRRKVREALLARRIERGYDKQRIFEVYVNHVFLGAGAYGVAAAARAYFSRPLDHLDLAEVALIAGLAQAPGRADPYKNPVAARERRDQVLARMARAGFIDAAEAEAARARPVTLTPPVPAYGTLAPWYTERARRQIEETMPHAYRRGGLRIETAAAPVLALAAEDAARARVGELARGSRGSARGSSDRSSARPGTGQGDATPQVGAVIWDHHTGYIEATVGGLSWDQSRFDRATQACRQPGSAFKPIVYAAALEAGAITPGTPLRDAPIAIYDLDLDVHWKPDSSRAFRGVVLAQDALAASLNAPAVDVLDRVGTARVVDLARRLGITTAIAEVRPLALGASCVLPLELAGAFATFARQGRGIEPVFVVRVRRGDQVLVDRASPHDPTLRADRRLDRLAARAAASGQEAQAMKRTSAFQISDMLSDVVQRGTATDARRLGRPAAGKTGTTNDNTDAWFVGYTGRVVTAAWVGYDDPARTLGPRQDGAGAALPLWMRLTRLAEGARPPVDVPGAPPPGLVRVRIDRETGQLARPGAGGSAELWFEDDTAPTMQAGQLDGLPADLGRLSQEF